MFRFRLQVCTSMGGLTITTSCCCAIRAKAPVGRVPTNPSLKAGVSDGLIVRLSSRRSLNWALALTVPDFPVFNEIRHAVSCLAVFHVDSHPTVFLQQDSLLHQQVLRVQLFQ